MLSLSMPQPLSCTQQTLDGSLLYIILDTIGQSSAIYFIAITVLLMTLMSIERWLHMSRRSSVTSRLGYFTVIILLLIPIPIVVFRVLANSKQSHASLLSYLTILLLFVDTSSKSKQSKHLEILVTQQWTLRNSRNL